MKIELLSFLKITIDWRVKFVLDLVVLTIFLDKKRVNNNKFDRNLPSLRFVILFKSSRYFYEIFSQSFSPDES